MILFFSITLSFNNVPVLSPPKPLTPELADQAHRSGLVSASFLPPATLEGIAAVPEYKENLRHLKFLMYGGAPLPFAIGDQLRMKTRLINSYGATELGLVHQLPVDAEDYAYVRFGSLANVELRPHSDGLYEAVMIRKKGLENYQGAFMVDPHLQELGTNDLFQRHPDPAKSDHWTNVGRSDDIIVFETGEKINPVSMERLIETHPKVRSALVIGEGSFQAAMLVEPVKDVKRNEESKQLLEDIWPLVEAANVEYPAHGYVVKELVIFTEPRMPIVRTDKGSIARKATGVLYKDILDKAYAAADSAIEYDGPILDLPTSTEKLYCQLRDLVRHSTAIDVQGEDDDFYGLGMDSLRTLQLSRGLKAALRNSEAPIERITPSLVYSNPTLRQLRESISSFARDAPNDTAKTERLLEMEAILSRYSSKLPDKASRPPPSKIVILTGSTGSLGSYLLSSLYADQSITHIWCLNRSPDALARQTATNASRGLSSTFESSRVTFQKCDFSQPLLGLSQSIYDEILGKVTHIIHNAWTVDFNLSLASLAQTNISGTCSLINLAADSANHAQMFFVSSIGTVMNWTKSGQEGPVPEEIIDNMAVAQPIGYAESKYIAERLLGNAHDKSGVGTCCLRVGQIAGPIGTSKGVWNRSEWLPALVATSRELGMLPTSLGAFNHVDWIPVNVLADVIVELANHGAQGKENAVYNLVNPSATTWDELYPIVQRCLEESRRAEVKAVEYSEWLKAVRKSVVATRTKEDFQRNPAVKLMDFFDSIELSTDKGLEQKAVRLSTKKVEQNSAILRSCGPVTPEWMQLWMRQWGYHVAN